MGAWYSPPADDDPAAPPPAAPFLAAALPPAAQKRLHAIISDIREEFSVNGPFTPDYATVAGRHVRFIVNYGHRHDEVIVGVTASDSLVAGLSAFSCNANTSAAAIHALEKLAYTWCMDGRILTVGPTAAHRPPPLLLDGFVARGEADSRCPVCYDAPAAWVLVSCGHGLCAACTRRLAPPLCPLCRCAFTAALPRAAFAAEAMWRAPND